jgi:RNA polymerase sigma factor (sigma-70 family)
MGRLGTGALGTGEVLSLDPRGASVLDLEETRIIQDAVAGDIRSFEALYRRHAGRTYAVALRVTASPERAEEVVQDVFVQAWKRLGSFEGRSRFGTWLHRLTVNRALDTVRSELRRAAREAPRGEREDRPGDEAEIERPEPSAGGPGDGHWDLERAVAGLPTGARTVFVLHDVEGYRHEEIAALTGIAVGTSKAQLHRARRLLRGRLTL